MIDKKVIIKCLDEHGFNPEPMDAEDAEWLIRGAIRGMPFIVVKPDTKEFVILQRVLNIAEDELKYQRDTEEQQRKRFINRLKHDLLLSGARYQMEFEDEDDTVLEKITLTTVLYEDGFAKDLFMEKLFSLHDASLLISVNLQENRFEQNAHP